MTTPYWKLPFLLVATYCANLCLSPPNPPAKSAERSKFVSNFQFGLKDALPTITVFYKVIVFPPFTTTLTLISTRRTSR